MSTDNCETAVTSEHVSRLIEIAACSASEAEHLLAACANDVEAAVSLFFEQGAVGGSTESTVPTEEISTESDVRAPIAPVREQLIGPEDDNFFASAPPAPTRRLARVTQRIKVCPLRDFAREGALMEEQMQAGEINLLDPSAVRNRRYDRSANMVATAQSSDPFNRPGTSSRLGDLFRPPTDLLYTGSFQAARAYATRHKQWLLVNVQGDNFNSQLLNRDVWSEREVKKVIRRHFTFWQVDCDTSEGRRFVAFYKCVKLPYMCAIDPRTGEEVWQSPDPKQINVLSNLQKFLNDHKVFSVEIGEETPTTSNNLKRQIASIDVDDIEDSCSSSSESNKLPKKRTKILELTEEEQLKLAIKNSMDENSVNFNEKSGIVDEIESDSESLDDAGIRKAKSEYNFVSYEETLGNNTDEMTALKLRLLNISGNDEVIQLRWPSDTMLQVLRQYILQNHSHIPKEGYKLICAFPRKTLESKHNTSSLKELGLHPSANLHLTLDD